LRRCARKLRSGIFRETWAHLHRFYTALTAREPAVSKINKQERPRRYHRWNAIGPNGQ
jgi:hypothetical protein